MKNVAELTEDGAFALFFRPLPVEFDTSRVSTPGNLPSKAKKMLMPGTQLQNSTECHLNRPGKTRIRSVKGILALFCYILIFGLF